MNSEKKFLKAYGDAFYDVQLLGFFYNNLGLGTDMEHDVIIFKLSLCIKFSFWLFPFKLLSFLNKLSNGFQIGLKWKLFEVVFGNAWDKMFNWCFESIHYGLKCALGGSLGINIISFQFSFPLWNIQSEKHFSAYFQMLWNYFNPVLTHFYWIKSFMRIQKRRNLRKTSEKYC